MFQRGGVFDEEFKKGDNQGKGDESGDREELGVVEVRV